MVFKPEPLFRAVEELRKGSAEANLPVVLLSPQGRILKHGVAEELAQKPHTVLICGRYEGVDERVAESLATDELSIGDYVLSGGELPAAVVMEAVIRLLPGVLGNEESRAQDSFTSSTEGETTLRHPGLLDFPQYTRPADFRGQLVPEVLLSGNHEEIRQWRHRQALIRTWRRRPDLLLNLPLGSDDRQTLEELQRLTCESVRT
jgi:tRNA (guanine37-N1)-methyltransferase